jgi:hypothetical protein
VTATIGDDAKLPVIPRPRSSGCPLEPPPEFAEWRASAGLRRVMWQGRPRVEMQIALSTLIRRLPGLQLAVPADELRFQNKQEIYGIEELPITW